MQENWMKELTDFGKFSRLDWQLGASMSYIVVGFGGQTVVDKGQIMSIAA